MAVKWKHIAMTRSREELVDNCTGLQCRRTQHAPQLLSPDHTITALPNPYMVCCGFTTISTQPRLSLSCFEPPHCCFRCDATESCRYCNTSVALLRLYNGARCVCHTRGGLNNGLACDYAYDS